METTSQESWILSHNLTAVLYVQIFFLPNLPSLHLSDFEQYAGQRYGFVHVLILILNLQCEPQIVREGKAYPPMAEKAGLVGDVASKVVGGVMGALRWVSGSGSK